MRRLRNNELGYLFLVLLLVAAVAWPFLSRAGLPRQTDAELHVFRLAELARLVSGGEVYPRWAPHFYFGYGYPIFNYYAPLAYYLGLPLALAPNLGPVAGAKFVFVLTYLAGALGMYGFVRSGWGRNAGVIAVASYLFAPYLQYIDPHARGDLAEFLSFGLFPVALWTVDNLRRDPAPGAFLAAIVATGMVIVSHNLMALVFFAVLCAWFLWQCLLNLWWRRRQEPDLAERSEIVWLKTRGTWIAAALALAVMLTAFFWLPVALEQDAVNLSSLIGDGGHFDFRNHFVGLSELLGPSLWLDWGATEPEFRHNLGVAQWLLALLGISGLVLGYARRRAHAAFFAVAAVVLVFLTTPASTVLWESVPLMPYLQFPWRLLGPAAAMLAVLAGVGVQSLLSFLHNLDANAATEREQLSDWQEVARSAMQWAPAFFLLVVLLQALPLSMVPPWPDESWDTSAPAVMVIERQGRWLGTTSTADFVPRTVEVIPRPQREMVDRFIEGGSLDRVNRATLPQDATVVGSEVTPLNLRYQVKSDSDFLLRLFLFDFPGWEVTIDRRPVQTILGRPEGFIVVPVPAGSHVVEVHFTETGERRVSWLISALAALLSGVGAIVAGRSEVRQFILAHAGRGRSLVGDTAAALGPALTVTATVLVVYTFAQGQGLFHIESQGIVAIPARQHTYANLNQELALIGFDAPDVAERGEVVEVALYWKAEEELDDNYQVFVHLLDSAGAPVAQSDKLNPGDFPTRRWPLDKYVRDSHRLLVPESISPGVYQLSTGMWLQSDGRRLPVFDRSGQEIGDRILVTKIIVR